MDTRRIRIKNSKYNEIYEKIQTERIPEYLKRKTGKKEQSLIARFRCGNEARESQMWREEKEKKMQDMWNKNGSLEHIS